MAKYSNTTKKPGQHLKGLREHWKLRRTDKRYTDKRNTAVNDCFRPHADASKADLAEYHRENMGLRRAHQRSRKPNTQHSRNHSIAGGNRHTGTPHLHRRETDRRERQSA